MASITETEVISEIYEDYYKYLFGELFTESENLNGVQRNFVNICIDSKYKDIDFNHQGVVYTKVSVEIQKRVIKYLLCGRKSEFYFLDLADDIHKEYLGSPEYNKCEVGNSFEDFVFACAKKCQALADFCMYDMLSEYPDLKLNADSTQDFALKMVEVANKYYKQFFKKKEVASLLVRLYDNYKKLR